MSETVSVLDSGRYISSREGRLELLKNQILFAMIEDVCTSDYPIEDCIADYVDAGSIGRGVNATVWRLKESNIAIKVSSCKRRDKEVSRYVADNLVGQMAFMLWFGRELDRCATEDNIKVPKQYIAFQTPVGDYVHVQEYMAGWQVLNPNNTHDNDKIQQRLTRVVGKLALISHLGADDLIVEPDQRLAYNNILIPYRATNIDEAPLCVIDQPQPSWRGRIAAYAATRFYKVQAHFMSLLNMTDVKVGTNLKEDLYDF